MLKTGKQIENVEGMDHTNKFFITVTGTLNSPWDKNWKECVQTWGKELIIKGYDLKIVIGDPDLDTEYKTEGNFLYVKCNDAKLGLVDKALLSNKYFIEQTNCLYHVRVDSDTYVEPSRFDEWCKEIITKEGIDYLGCVTPYNMFMDVPYQYVPVTDGRCASGTMYFISRKSATAFIENYTEEFLIDDGPNKWNVEAMMGFDDLVVGRVLLNQGIHLHHDSRIYFNSPFPDANSGHHVTNWKTGEIMGVPLMTDNWWVAQHGCDGHMKELEQIFEEKNKQ